jgi:hypothetical protein
VITTYSEREEEKQNKKLAFTHSSNQVTKSLSSVARLEDSSQVFKKSKDLTHLFFSQRKRKRRNKSNESLFRDGMELSHFHEATSHTQHNTSHQLERN